MFIFKVFSVFCVRTLKKMATDFFPYRYLRSEIIDDKYFLLYDHFKFNKKFENLG